MLSYLNLHFYTKFYLRERADFLLGIHQRQKILSKSLKGPVGIALHQRWCILISSLFRRPRYKSIQHWDAFDAGEINSRNCCADAVTS